MKKIVLFSVLALALPVGAQNILNPLNQLFTPNQPQNGKNGNNSNATAAVGAAIGGILGAKQQRTAEGSVIGGALGLILGQMLEPPASQPTAPGGTPTASGPGAANLPQIDPATGLPVDPNAAGSEPPMIDPTTGLPVQRPASAWATIPNGGQATPRLKRLRSVNKLFGR